MINEEVNKILDEISQVTRLLARRKERLAHFNRQLPGLPDLESTRDRELRMVQQAELRVRLANKKLELVSYQFDADELDKSREQTLCPACKFIYETPDGRKLTEEEIDRNLGGCTKYPQWKKDCPDFKDYGVCKWDVYHQQHYQKLMDVRNLAIQTQAEISGLEKQIKDIKIN